MSLSILTVRSEDDIKRFIMLPWKIYRGNKNWVPPMIKDFKDTLDPVKNPLFKKGEHELYLALLDGIPAGRICVGIDTELNMKKGTKTGYITLFECINDYGAAEILFNASISWLRKRDISIVRGPIPPTGGDSDEYKGLLIDSFDRPPVLMNSYNPGYYVGFFDRYGFIKDSDLFAYYLDKGRLFAKDPGKIIKYAEKKYGFRVDKINMKNLEEEIKALKYILDLAIPDEWPDIVAPSLDDVGEMAKKLMPVADPDIIIIARAGSEPVGFGIALPNYNEILIHLNGRLTPLAILKYFWYKRKIGSVRFFIMFVIPAFRKKGVSHAIYYQTFVNGVKKGYTWGEGSTIGETNLRMRNDIESVGGEHYKTYRIYRKDI